MTQKELNYLEDIYNHEKLIIDTISSSMELITDENYIDLFEKQLDIHTNNTQELEALLGGNNG